MRANGTESNESRSASRHLEVPGEMRH